ncbi:ABC transporter substrate-binding protein [Microbacterium sp. ZXX196]|uniref:ABC transporter substrate-binding protein n=1 Tax=Microbacterium sp. ZXX196 TaxID=2609291 RepID=UPI0012B91D4F|nr:ABC transporter substrate-binding protein [Microbacterium sp. ZXX196]MTE23385.1 ABC transporter substrate-binding protein [Microbacterium sp. ZXX196]
MTLITRRRALAAASTLGVATLALTACSGGTTADDAAADLEVGSLDLSAVCPADIVVQTDWNPQAEHGHLFQLIGDDYTIDADNKSVSSPLVVDGEYTGVNFEVRAGGPAIGYSTVNSIMFQDDAITLGYVHSDAAISSSAITPVVGVMAQMDVNPQMVMWDPETYPDVETIEDLAAALEESGGAWRYFGGAAYMEYLLAAGIVPESIVDGGYDGTPASFVADDGLSAQQGFASAEPYIYANEVEAWNKPVEYALIADAGWDIYGSALSVRADKLEELSPCLEELVPILQQAEVDFFADPSDTVDLILELVAEYNNGWTYSQGVADYAVETLIEEGIVSNGDNGYIGDFDAERVSEFFGTGMELFQEIAADVDPDLAAEDIYTNEFLDTSIGLPE